MRWSTGDREEWGVLTLCCIWAEEHRHVHGKQPVRWESCHPHPQCSGPSSWPLSRGPSIHQSLLCGTETSLKRKHKRLKQTFFLFFPPLPSDWHDCRPEQTMWSLGVNISAAHSHKTKAKSSSLLSDAQFPQTPILLEIIISEILYFLLVYYFTAIVRLPFNLRITVLHTENNVLTVYQVKDKRDKSLTILYGNATNYYSHCRLICWLLSWSIQLLFGCLTRKWEICQNYSDQNKFVG